MTFILSQGTDKLRASSVAISLRYLFKVGEKGKAPRQADSDPFLNDLVESAEDIEN